MSRMMMSVIFLVCVIGGLAFAAKRGLRLPLAVCLVLIILGGLLVLAPATFSFLLQALGRATRISENEQIPCWILGGIMVLVGIVGALFSKRSSVPPPQ